MFRVFFVLMSIAVAVRAAGPPVSRALNLRADVNIVLVPVTVTNRSGAVVNGLPASSFTVLEDKIPQPIVSFGSEEVPASVGIVLDLSGSMRSKAVAATAALRAFLDNANPDDEAFLFTVSTRPETASAFSSDFESIAARTFAAQPAGATALVDSIYLALNQMRGARNQHKALLIISDGMDNHSRYTARELMRLAEEAGVQIYTIGMMPSLAGRRPIELSEEGNGLMFLDRLSEATGGLNLTLATYENPALAATRISRAIRDQYLIGYRSADKGEPGKWRAIQVKVSLPKVHVSSRPGYYAR